MDRLARYSWLTLAYNVLVVLWGTAVRATGSGAGCGSHWPLCNGVVIPQAPRIETLIELSHRVTSGIALLLVAGLVWMAFRRRPKGHAARTWAVWSMIFMLGEAAVGAGLVLFELVADNKSVARALFMGTHLLNTFFLLATLALAARAAAGGADFPGRRLWHRSGLPGAGLWPGLLGLLLAGMSGAIAALGDTLFPSMTLDQALKADFSPAAHLLIRLRILHPVIAVAAGLYVAWMGLQLFKRHLGPEVALYGRLTAALVFFQICAGVINVALLAPIWMQIVHLLLADLLWIAFVMLSAAVLAAFTPPETARA